MAGADFIVDATIELFGDQPTKLMRIDRAANRWLIANVRFGADTTQAPVSISGGTATVDGQPLTAHGSGTCDAEVIGVSGSSGKQRASYQVFGGDTASGLIAFVLTWSAQNFHLRVMAFSSTTSGRMVNRLIIRKKKEQANGHHGSNLASPAGQCQRHA